METEKEELFKKKEIVNIAPRCWVQQNGDKEPVMDLLTWKSLDNLGKIEFNQLVRSENLDLRSLKRDWGVKTWKQCV